MAYGRYSRRRRVVRRRRPGTRSIRRTTRRTTPRYRRPRRFTRRPRLMSRRGINDLTSRKKKDNMLTFSNITIPRSPAPPVSNTAALLQGGGGYYNILWCASARERVPNNTGGIGTVDDESTRTATTVYAKGLRERLSIQTNSAVPWTWRRIVFTCKGTAALFATTPLFLLTSNGYARLVQELGSGATAQVQGMVFDGTVGLDWRDPLDAKIDQTLFTILSDQTTIITPQTTAGAIRNYSRYYPLEKNLTYYEDEQGGENSSAAFSTLGKPGMGDLMVYDIFAPKGGAAFTDQMTVDIQSTFYWHEK